MRRLDYTKRANMLVVLPSHQSISSVPNALKASSSNMRRNVTCQFSARRHQPVGREHWLAN
eukprot:scaffold81158_cov36-Attheya_sp.AAC.1